MSKIYPFGNHFLLHHHFNLIIIFSYFPITPFDHYSTHFYFTYFISLSLVLWVQSVIYHLVISIVTFPSFSIT